MRRRAPIALVLTAAGLTGLAVFRTRPVATNLPRPSLSLSASTEGAGSTTSTTVPSPTTSTSAPRSGASPATTTIPASTTTLAPPSSTTTTAPTTAPTTATTSPAATRSATGEVVDYSYGTLSVSVTVSGHTISKVAIASLDDGGNFRSQSIDEQSIPILEQEALQAQSANIQGVSGASYTSEGFVQSLQNALPKAGR